MRKFVQLLGIALIATPGIAQAAEPPCLTAREFTDLSSYALPSIITGAAERCSVVLGASSYLKRSGGTLASRYAAGRSAAWPGAKAAFLKLSGADAGSLLKNMPDDKLQPMANTLVEGLVAQQLPTERCQAVDVMVRITAQLQPRDLAELIAVTVGLGSQAGGGKVGKLAICAA